MKLQTENATEKIGKAVCKKDESEDLPQQNKLLVKTPTMANTLSEEKLLSMQMKFISLRAVATSLQATEKLFKT